MGDLLQMNDVSSGYGASQVLFGVSLEVRSGELVTLLGRNGMGKTTTVRALFRELPLLEGDILLRGESLAHTPPYLAARAGLGLVPEGRQVFANLTVRENLIATAANRRGHADPWIADRVYGMFPQLKERADNYGSQLSGG
ncbi:MAG: ATP-binding cassette domain-containing protein, partial [Pseudomonadota bacterium]|nr:ATP-binding cassette domain-containing protein [Pseudomonadota bacterium]